ncbi:MAG: SMI1/KNR4 family protein [Filimonas sp.]|nr:SMI1/KNR4 family protein [Filimonas sp.]
MMQLSLTENAFQINEVNLQFPIDILTLKNILGECRLTKTQYNNIYTWDAHGIAAYSKDGIYAESIDVCLVKGSHSFSPVRTFTGQLLFDRQDAIAFYNAHKEKRVKLFDSDSNGALILKDISLWFAIKGNNITGISISAYQPPAIPDTLPVDAAFMHYIPLWKEWIDTTTAIVPVNNPYYNLTHGITEDDIKKYTLIDKASNILIPDALVNFYKINNVTYNVVTSAFSFYVNNWAYCLIPFNRIGEEWSDIDGLNEEDEMPDLPEYSRKIKTGNYSNPGWIPFAQGYNGDCLLFDTDPGEEGTYGQIIELQNESWERNVVAGSLEELLQNEILSLKNGVTKKFDFILPDKNPKNASEENGKEMKLPEALLKLFDFQENVSSFEYYAEGFGVIEDDKTGLKTWARNKGFLNRLNPFAQANGTGSFYTIWNDGTGKPVDQMPIAVFGDEGGIHIVARNILELLQMLTYDAEIYVDFDSAYFYKDEDDYEESPDHKAYLDWLKENYNLGPVEDPDRLIEAAQQQYKQSFDAWLSLFFDREDHAPVPPPASLVYNNIPFKVINRSDAAAIIGSLTNLAGHPIYNLHDDVRFPDEANAVFLLTEEDVQVDILELPVIINEHPNIYILGYIFRKNLTATKYIKVGDAESSPALVVLGDIAAPAIILNGNIHYIGGNLACDSITGNNPYGALHIKGELTTWLIYSNDMAIHIARLRAVQAIHCTPYMKLPIMVQDEQGNIFHIEKHFPNTNFLSDIVNDSYIEKDKDGQEKICNEYFIFPSPSLLQVQEKITRYQYTHFREQFVAMVNALATLPKVKETGITSGFNSAGIYTFIVSKEQGYTYYRLGMLDDAPVSVRRTGIYNVQENTITLLLEYLDENKDAQYQWQGDETTPGTEFNSTKHAMFCAFNELIKK